MSFEQMAILFSNSGELYKRFNRRISYATFTTTNRYIGGGIPVFAIVSRRNTGGDHVCSSYEEALKILEEHNVHVHSAVHEMTPKRYALLVEALCHRHSPQNRTRWHSTAYERLYVSPTYNGIEIHYKFNSHGKSELPWSLEARDFGIFVQHYYDLGSIGRTPFDETDLKLKRGRRSGRTP